MNLEICKVDFAPLQVVRDTEYEAIPQLKFD